MKVIFFYQLSPSKLKTIIVKKILCKQLQLILIQFIVMQEISDSSILGFTQVTQHILNIIYAMNSSGVKFNQSLDIFYH